MNSVATDSIVTAIVGLLCFGGVYWAVVMKDPAAAFGLCWVGWTVMQWAGLLSLHLLGLYPGDSFLGILAFAGITGTGFALAGYTCVPLERACRWVHSRAVRPGLER